MLSLIDREMLYLHKTELMGKTHPYMKGLASMSFEDMVKGSRK